MARKLWRFCQLSVAEQQLIVLITVMLPLLELSLRLVGFNVVYRILHRSHPQNAVVALSLDAMQTERTIVHFNHRLRQISRRHPFPGRCLAQSLLLWWLLRRRGIESLLRFGQRTANGLFAAHAWVEYVGQPINADKAVSQTFFPFAEAIRLQ